MWLMLGIGSGAVVVVLSLLQFNRRKRTRTIDVGSLSETWLAEERGRTTD